MLILKFVRAELLFHSPKKTQTHVSLRFSLLLTSLLYGNVVINAILFFVEYFKI